MDEFWDEYGLPIVPPEGMVPDTNQWGNQDLLDEFGFAQAPPDVLGELPDFDEAERQATARRQREEARRRANISNMFIARPRNPIPVLPIMEGSLPPPRSRANVRRNPVIPPRTVNPIDMVMNQREVSNPAWMSVERGALNPVQFLLGQMNATQQTLTEARRNPIAAIMDQREVESTTTASSTVNNIVSTVVNTAMDVIEAVIPVPDTVSHFIRGEENIDMSEEERPPGWGKIPAMNSDDFIPMEVNEFIEENREELRLAERAIVLKNVKITNGNPFNWRSGKLIQYRILDRAWLSPQHRFNNAVQFSPESSSGDRTVDDVICTTLNDCLDVSNQRHEFNGRFHTICAVSDGFSSTLTGGAALQAELRAEAEGYIEEGEVPESLLYVTTTVAFNIMTIRNSTFASLEIGINTREHETYEHGVNQGFVFLNNHIVTGGLGGYDLALVRVKFDRFTLLVQSTRGRLARDENDQYRPARFYTVRLGPYPIERLGGVVSDFAIQLQRDYLEKVNSAIDGAVGGGSDDVNDDISNWQELTRDERNLRRVEKMTIQLLARTVFEQKPTTDVTQFTPHVFLQSIPPPIQRAGNHTSIGWNAHTRITNPEMDDEALGIQIAPVEEIEEGEIVGCLIDKEKRPEAAIYRLEQLYKPPQNNKNNCFFDCLAEAHTDMNLRVVLSGDPRTHFNITHGNHLSKEELQLIANELKQSYVFHHMVKTPYNAMTLQVQQDPILSRIAQTISHDFTIQPDPLDPDAHRLHFLLHNEHCYWLIKPEIVLKKVKCSTCSQWINRESFSQHITLCRYCVECHEVYRSYRPTDGHNCGVTRRLLPFEQVRNKLALNVENVCTDWIRMNGKKKGKKITSARRIFFADIEAFPDVTQSFTAYAIGLLCLTNYQDKSKVEIFYGDDCFERYFEHLAQLQGTVYYYNGSGFDNFLHVNAMVNQNLFIDPAGFVKKGSRIMSFQHHSRLRVHDLYLFTQSSLVRAGAAWGVPKEMLKTDFEHGKVFDYDSADEHREEVSEYLRYDVLCLAHLFKIYHETMWKAFSMDMNLCISPAQYAIQVWSADNIYLNDIYIPHRGKEERDDRAAYYGGRVMCQRKEYTSEDWSDGRENYDFDCVEDYLVLGDVNSLYPAAQMQNLFAYGKWRYIEGREDMPHMLNTGLYNDDEILRSCYCVDVDCPRTLLTSFLMERDAQGSIVHSLEPKMKCWYWGCELKEAIELGYRVTKVYEVKEFEKLGPLFKGMIL